MSTPDTLREEIARTIFDEMRGRAGIKHFFLHVPGKPSEGEFEDHQSWLEEVASGILALPALASRVEGWRTMESAPRDGKSILAFCVHANARYAGENFSEWTEIVTTRWIGHNDGGWTWNGICGVHTHWMPLPAAPACPQGAAPDMLAVLKEIVEECHNGGYPNEIVATRMIERIEEIAMAVLAKAEGRTSEGQS